MYCADLIISSSTNPSEFVLDGNHLSVKNLSSNKITIKQGDNVIAVLDALDMITLLDINSVYKNNSFYTFPHKKLFAYTDGTNSQVRIFSYGEKF